MCLLQFWAVFIQVVTLDAGMTSVVFTEADLARQVSVLQHAGSTAEQLVCALRTLSCLVLGAPQFVAMPVLQLSVEVRHLWYKSIIS